MDEFKRAEADAVAAITTAALNVKMIQGMPAVVIPNGYQMALMDELLPAPLRIKDTIHLDEVESFTRYVNLFKGEGTQILVNKDSGKAICTFDYHSPEQPRHCSHKAALKLTTDFRFNAWERQNRKMFDQTGFAEFIEERSLDIREPSAATLMEVTKNLKGAKKVTFQSGKDLSNGSVQFTYNEEVKGSIGKNNLTVPETFTIGIPMFQGGEAYKIIANLRYKIDGEGLLLLSYVIPKLQELEETAWAGIVKEIEEKTGIKPFIGAGS